MTTTELLIAVPLLGRPHRVEPVLEFIRDATPEDHRVLLLCTRGDTAVIRKCEQMASEREHIDLTILPQQAVGDFAKKLNYAYRTGSEPFLMMGADDLAFQPGWWPAARRYFDDPKIGVVGTNDLAPTKRAQAGEHSTHCVIRREYVDAHGLITGERAVLYEGYVHEYCDDELVGTAKKRGAWVYAEDSVVEHLHMNWGKAPSDPMYRQATRRMIMSRRLFQQRRKLWE
jgi:hypothetical protein